MQERQFQNKILVKEKPFQSPKILDELQDFTLHIPLQRPY